MKLKKYVSLLIASVLLVTMAFAGAASADAANTSIGSWAELKQNITNWNNQSDGGMLTIILNKDLETEEAHDVDIPVQKNVTIKPDETADRITLSVASVGRYFNITNGGNLILEGNNSATLKLMGGLNPKGGVVYLDNGSVNKLTLNDGVTISGNTGVLETIAWGGGVYVGSDSIFTMNGGNITDCSARSLTGNAYGGGVYVNNEGTFIMKGGNIEKNIVNDNGGGVYVCNGGMFNVTGSATVKDNTLNDWTTVNNVYLESDNSLNLLNNVFTGSVGINYSNGAPELNKKFGAAVSGATGAEHFFSDDGNFMGSIEDNKLTWSEKPKEYDIYIANKTNTYQLTSTLTKVYSDNGIGYANLSVIDTETGTYTLELNGFNASNMSNVPIIKADDTVQDLKIILKGDSNLTGDYNTDECGLLEVDGGNLTIISDSNFPGKLLVNNTVTATDGSSTAIDVDKTLTIDAGANITAIAHSQSAAYAIYSHNNDIIIRGADTVVEANATSSTDAYGLMSDSQNILIDSGAKLTANVISNADAPSEDYYAEALYAKYAVIISGNSEVTATAESTGNASAYAIHAYRGNIEINASTVKATANTTNGDYAEALYAKYAVIISDDSDVTATAESTDNADTYAIEADYGNIEIDTSTVNAIANTTYGDYAEALNAEDDVIISGNSDVTATAESTGNASAYPIDANGNIEIDASTVKATATTTNGDFAEALLAKNAVIISDNSDVTATAEAPGGADAYACAIKAYGDIEITGTETEVIGNAISSNLAITFLAENNLTINSAKRITAIGTALPGLAASFAYNYLYPGIGKLNIDGLADYAFSNATYSGEEPKTFESFKGNWYFDSDIDTYVSHYSAVTIEKKSTPTPTPSSGGSRQTGYTQIRRKSRRARRL